MDRRESRILDAIDDERAEEMRAARDRLLDVYCFLSGDDRRRVEVQLANNRKRVRVLPDSTIVLI